MPYLYSDEFRQVSVNFTSFQRSNALKCTINLLPSANKGGTHAVNNPENSNLSYGTDLSFQTVGKCPAILLHVHKPTRMKAHDPNNQWLALLVTPNHGS